MTNTPTYISQLELSAPNEVFFNPKYQLVFLFCMEQELVLLQKDGFQEKRNIKSPVISPLRKNPIPNQDSTIIITQQDPIIPPLLANWYTGYKSFFNYTHFQIK